MLGKTAGGLFWMFRYLERSENTARLLEAESRIALTRASSEGEDWDSVVSTSGVRHSYCQKYDQFDATNVIDFLLRDPDNSSSVLAVVESARNNARLVRTALTREVWEAVNVCWMTLKDLLANPVRVRELPEVLGTIRQQSALVRGALHGTMMRNDIFDFARLGMFVERADNTARILDVKYYVLLPSVSYVGSSLDNVQWEIILRSVSAQGAYRWQNEGDINPKGIARFLMLDRCMPRSLAFCYGKIVDNLSYLAEDYGMVHESHGQAATTFQRLRETPIEEVFDSGLHEFIEEFIRQNNLLGQQIQADYRFTG